MSVNLPGYTDVEEFGEYGYDWNIVRLYTRDGRVFALRDGGCSCNDFGDRGLDESDLVELPTLDAAARYFTNAFEWSGPKWLNIVDSVRALGLR